MSHFPGKKRSGTRNAQNKAPKMYKQPKKNLILLFRNQF